MTLHIEKVLKQLFGLQIFFFFVPAWYQLKLKILLVLITRIHINIHEHMHVILWRKLSSVCFHWYTPWGMVTVLFQTFLTVYLLQSLASSTDIFDYASELKLINWQFKAPIFIIVKHMLLKTFSVALCLGRLWGCLYGESSMHHYIYKAVSFTFPNLTTGISLLLILSSILRCFIYEPHFAHSF